MFKAVLFDLDGTLLNTLDDLRDSLNEILILKGFSPRTIEDVRSFVGNGVRNLVRLSVPTSCNEEEVDQILMEFKEHYSHNK